MNVKMIFEFRACFVTHESHQESKNCCLPHLIYQCGACGRLHYSAKEAAEKCCTKKPKSLNLVGGAEM